MIPDGLNLDLLRKNPTLRGPAFDTGFLELFSSEQAVRLSRRGLLGLAGSALSFAAPQGPGTLEVRRSPGRLVFLVDGQEYWDIDVVRFSGTPELSWIEGDRSFEFGLTRALFPGTNIPANIRCLLKETPSGWSMDLQLDCCSFQVALPVIPWLRGEQRALSPIRLTSGWHLGGATDLQLRGRALAEFRPDWTLRLAGSGIARLSSAPLRVRADRAILSLPSSEPSLFEAPASRRTFVTLEAGKQNWSLPVATAAEDWKLHLLAAAFDRMLVETGEGETGVALLATSPPQRITGAFTPSSELTSEEGSPLQLPLRNARSVFRSGPTGNEAVFLADLTFEPTLALGHSYHMELATGPETPPLEIGTVGANLTHLLFAPQIRQVQAPVEGGISSCSASHYAECASPGATHSSYEWWRVLFWPPNWAHRLRGLPMDSLSVRVVRPQDFLLLEFSFKNLVLERNPLGHPELEVPKAPKGLPQQPGVLVVTFPPQNISEQAFYEQDAAIPTRLPPYYCVPVTQPLPATDTCPPDPDQASTEETPSSPPVIARMSGKSRLVFEVPYGVEIRYDIRGLLDWSKLRPRLVNYADGPLGGVVGRTPPIQKPDQDKTAIESPYRVMLSPNSHSAWAHRTNAVCGPGNRTELWHTRMAVRGERGIIDEAQAQDRTVRAIWSQDYYPDDETYPGALPATTRSSLSQQDRHEFVRLTSDYSLDLPSAQHTAAVAVNRLMLSGIGSWMDVRGTWEPPNGRGLRVEEWDHKSTMGRDHYVKVVYKGYLFPFGHRASLIKVTERKFKRVGNAYIPYNRQRMYIVIRERLKRYPALGQPFSGRRFPGVSIEFREHDLTTPTLDNPESDPIKPSGPDPGGYKFVPRIQRVPFQFRFTYTDCEGSKILSCPLIFVDNLVAHAHPSATDQISYIIDTYNNPSLALRDLRMVDGHGLPFCIAPPASPGTTSVHVRSFRWWADAPDPADLAALHDADQPPFYPAIEWLETDIRQVAELSGQAATRDIRLHPVYIQNGFSPALNAGEIFAEIMTPAHTPDTGYEADRARPTRKPLYLTFGPDSDVGRPNGDRAGGLATPNCLATGLSRRCGVVAGVPRPGPPAQSAIALAARPRALARGPELPNSPATLDKFLQGKFDPFDYFGAGFADAKILGVVKLVDIIKVVAGPLLDSVGQAPKMLRNTLYDVSNAILPALIKGAQALTDAVNGLDQVSGVQQRLRPRIDSINLHVRELQDPAKSTELLTTYAGSGADRI